MQRIKETINISIYLYKFIYHKMYISYIFIIFFNNLLSSLYLYEYIEVIAKIIT